MIKSNGKKTSQVRKDKPVGSNDLVSRLAKDQQVLGAYYYYPCARDKGLGLDF